MSSRILSSGNATADRRADYAMMLAGGGEWLAATELMAQALDLAPDWAAGWFLLGSWAEKADDKAGAARAYRRAQSLAPDDLFGAGLRLALIGEGPLPDVPPSTYVKGLFDDYAGKFDASLVDRLGYIVPARLGNLVVKVLGADCHFGVVADLGCGTGLFGAVIMARADRLEGWDLSPNMLAKAAEKSVYHHLGLADLSLPPDRSGLFGHLDAHRADLVSAADVLMYLGNLEAAFANVARLLRPSGHFAFSVEKAKSAEGFELRPSMRYAHSRAHVEAVLGRHAMTVLDVEETTIRMDAGEAVTGILFVARALAAEML